MQNLKAIQSDFYKSLFQKKQDYPSFISSSYPSERFDVYRQTIFENMRNALQITFPGIWKLLGEESANSVANAFCKIEKHLPSTGCLDDFGKAFINFLGNLKELAELPYLKDYASYEWSKHKAYGAARSTYITASDLKQIPEDKIDNISFTLIPSLFLFSSSFPINDIQEIIENPNSSSINLTSTQAYNIILCPEDEVITFWIEQNLWKFIQYLTKGKTLAQATHKIQEKHPDFNLSDAIHFILEKQLIHKIIFPGEINDN